MFKRKTPIKQMGKKVACFLSNYIKVEWLVLFGSYSYGHPRHDSDFDIAVVSEDLDKMSVLEKIDLFSKAAVSIDSRLELKGFGRNEFLNPERGSMAEFIKNRGKIIYSAS